jgi:hypothetical protein
MPSRATALAVKGAHATLDQGEMTRHVAQDTEPSIRRTTLREASGVAASIAAAGPMA